MTFLRAAYRYAEPYLGTALLLAMAGYLAVSCLVAWGVAMVCRSCNRDADAVELREED